MKIHSVNPENRNEEVPMAHETGMNYLHPILCSLAGENVTAADLRKLTRNAALLKRVSTTIRFGGFEPTQIESDVAGVVGISNFHLARHIVADWSPYKHWIDGSHDRPKKILEEGFSLEENLYGAFNFEECFPVVTFYASRGQGDVLAYLKSRFASVEYEGFELALLEKVLGPDTGQDVGNGRAEIAYHVVDMVPKLGYTESTVEKPNSFNRLTPAPFTLMIEAVINHLVVHDKCIEIDEPNAFPTPLGFVRFRGFVKVRGGYKLTFEKLGSNRPEDHATFVSMKRW